jgi:hypothetical protein
MCSKLEALQVFHLYFFLGLDFDPARGGKYIRFSFAGSTPDMQEVRRRIHVHIHDTCAVVVLALPRICRSRRRRGRGGGFKRKAEVRRRIHRNKCM